MRILVRLTLLGLFASAGVALAVYVACSVGPAPGQQAQAAPLEPGANAEDERSGPAEQAGDSRSEAGGEHLPAPASSLPAPASNVQPPVCSQTSAAAGLGPSITMPEGALAVDAHPGQGLKPSSAGEGLGLAGTWRVWRSLAAPLLNQVALGAARAQESVPLPPAIAAPAGPVAPPRGETVRLASPRAAGADEGPLAVGEGDDSLAIQAPDSDIREVLAALSVQGNLNILATESVQGKVSATLNGVSVDQALDAILKSTGYVAKREGNFIYVGKPEDFDTLEKALDTVTTRVYRPNYVTAAELQSLIEPLITKGMGVVAVSSPSEVGIGADATNAGGDKFAGGEVVVVRDYEAVLAEIDQVVAEIDVRPMQVAIEAMILSVTLDDSNEFGVSFELLRDKEHVRLGWGDPITSLAKISFEDGGLKFGFLDGSLSAFLSALETIGDTNVIATPRLMVLNKHRAEILIGEELGYVSTTITETSSSQSVEFLEVGAQLRLRPFISSDGLIRMEVHPELSTGSVDTKSGFTLPNKDTTQVTTNIMVRDGCTVIIGGLMREELKTTGSQVPWLGNLPFVGVAFRNRNETLQRREILVLLTPHIVYEPETCQEGARGACEFHRRQDVYREKMNPLGKRYVARKYFRMAQNAWAAGDREAALRFIEMSVHFDPLNRAAIDLRSNIWLGQRVGDHTLDRPPALGDALATGPGSLGAGPSTPPNAPPPSSHAPSLDGTVIDPWLLEELGRESAPPALLKHPLDPGQPGRRVDVQRPRSFQ